jgi:hypothetical protein
MDTQTKHSKSSCELSLDYISFDSLLCYFACLVCFLTIPCQAQSADKLPLPHVLTKINAGQPVTIVGLGDSITTYYGSHNRNEGYYRVPTEVSYYGVFAAYLRMEFPQAVTRVINKGVGGETADRGLKRVESDVLSQHPDLVFVMYGANDGRGERDIDQYILELKTIVQKIRANGSDVILVAPTISLSDVSCLLPYRQAVLNLRGQINCTVLDGTIALWPVNDAVSDMREVYDYLSMLFPPNGDEIHPGFAGHFQMGRCLWKQLTVPSNPEQLQFSLNCKNYQPGSTELTLTIHNTSDSDFTGKIQPFFPPPMPIIEALNIVMNLPNHATGNLRSLNPLAITLAAGAQHTLTFHMELPELPDFLTTPSPQQWLDLKAYCGVATFTQSNNNVAYVHIQQRDLISRIVGPSTINQAHVAPIRVQISNHTSHPFMGTWEFVHEKQQHAVSVPAHGQNTYDVDLALPMDRTRGIDEQRAIVLRDQAGNIRGIDVIMVECTPCVHTPTRTVAVDGKLSDWNQATWYHIDAEKTKARFAVSRQNDTLYVAMYAQDPVIEFEKKPIWFGDGFELYFDSRPEDQLGTNGPLFQVGLFPPQAADAKLNLVPGTGATLDGIKSIHSAWQRTDEGYVIEVAIPMNLIIKSPIHEGQKFGFAIACNDVASQGANRTQYQWAGSTNNYYTPTGYSCLCWNETPHHFWHLLYHR